MLAAEGAAVTEKKTWSIDELALEAPVRKSRGGGALPKDPDWWFPPYVPAWARMLPRELYSAVFGMSSYAWEVEHALRNEKRVPRGRGRPRLTSQDEDMVFMLQVHATVKMLKEEGRSATEVAALRRMTGKKDVGAERTRLYRIKKAAQK